MTIARFSHFRVAVVIAFCLGICFPLWRILYLHADGDMHDWRFWLLFLFSPLAALYAFAILRELVFHNGRSVWISDGQLVFMPYGWPASLTSYLYRIPLGTIDRLTMGRMTLGGPLRPSGIIVHLKSARRVDLPTHLLAESREVVLARLNQALR
jgi:hypothetical protein